MEVITWNLKFMARHRLNPWPSMADLFSALFVGMVAALVFIGARAGEQEELQRESLRIIKELGSELEKEGGRQRLCEMDLCVDFDFHFEHDKDRLLIQGEEEVDNTCKLFKKAIQNRNEVMMVIEGHTDSTLKPDADLRHNWDLSAKRASVVLKRFMDCGVKVPEYHVSTAGYADTRPLCSEPTPACYERNRRITLRLRANQEVISRRLRK